MSLAAVGMAWLRASALLTAFPQALGLSVPVLIRALAALGLGLVMAAGSHGHAAPGLDAGLGEMLVGAGMGLCLRLPMVAVQSAGEAMGMNTNAVGLMMPGLSTDNGGGGNAWQATYLWVGLLVYMGAGGPQALLQTLTGSTQLVPLGQAGIHGSLALADLGPLAARTAALSMVLCLPPLLASMLTQWGLGLVFRASARLQLYGFSMPLASLAAVGALSLSLPTWPALLRNSLGWSMAAAAGVASGLGGHP